MLLAVTQGCRAQDSPLATPRPPKYNSAPGPVATHRFWSAKNWFATNRTDGGGTYTLFPEPLAVQTTPHGLLVGYSPTITVAKDFFVHPVQPDFTIGTVGLNAASVRIVANTDRMVDLDFGPLRTRVGRGMPFVYVETTSAEIALTFVSPPTVFATQDNLLGISLGQNLYGLFCPKHGTWTRTEKLFTCHLPPGHHYFSIALLPNSGAFAHFARFAFAFPVDTPLSWHYDQPHSQVTTTFDVTTEIKEGPDPGFLQALYPHQYTSLSGPHASTTDTYASARGPMRVLEARRFTTLDTFHGTLPFLPPPASFDYPAERNLLKTVAAEHNLFPAPDTYGQGKSLARIAQLLPLAQLSNEPLVLERFRSALRSQFALWSAPGDRKQDRFLYDRDWGTLIGYPASFGSNTQLNDHHFHYGYWIHAAAMLGLYDPAWLARPENAAFINELARDVANIDPHDPKYPMLRHFDAYAGHSWASGQAPFGDGQNEESSAEAINAWAGLILFAAETNNLPLRDAAIWMYTLETNAATDYWFNDGPVRTFPAGFDRTQVANLFDGKADAATWFGNAPEFEHGIEFLPFTGASLYLGRDPAYVRHNLAEVTRTNGGAIRRDSAFWPDLMEMYQSFYDPRGALAAWHQTGFVFDGETKAHEFAWLSSMAALGTVDESVTADTPFFAVFRDDSGHRTHIAFNPGATPLSVHFSDGAMLSVPVASMAIEGRVLKLPR
jgi:endoglucanase Acf2